jgi:hypothetical protein
VRGAAQRGFRREAGVRYKDVGRRMGKLHRREFGNGRRGSRRPWPGRGACLLVGRAQPDSVSRKCGKLRAQHRASPAPGLPRRPHPKSRDRARAGSAGQ